MSVNKVILIGNVGKDPEIRHLESTNSVASFSLATSETYTNKSGEKVTQTEWHNIVCWRGLSTIAEKYVRKGSQIYIEGRIRSRSYDAKDGTKRYITEILADDLRLLDRKGNGQPADESSSEARKTVNSPVQEDEHMPAGGEVDDLPF